MTEAPPAHWCFADVASIHGGGHKSGPDTAAASGCMYRDYPEIAQHFGPNGLAALDQLNFRHLYPKRQATAPASSAMDLSDLFPHLQAAEASLQAGSSSPGSSSTGSSRTGSSALGDGTPQTSPLVQGFEFVDTFRSPLAAVRAHAATDAEAASWMDVDAMLPEQRSAFLREYLPEDAMTQEPRVWYDMMDVLHGGELRNMASSSSSSSSLEGGKDEVAVPAASLPSGTDPEQARMAVTMTQMEDAFLQLMQQTLEDDVAAWMQESKDVQEMRESLGKESKALMEQARAEAEQSQATHPSRLSAKEAEAAALRAGFAEAYFEACKQLDQQQHSTQQTVQGGRGRSSNKRSKRTPSPQRGGHRTSTAKSPRRDHGPRPRSQSSSSSSSSVRSSQKSQHSGRSQRSRRRRQRGHGQDPKQLHTDLMRELRESGLLQVLRRVHDHENGGDMDAGSGLWGGTTMTHREDESVEERYSASHPIVAVLLGGKTLTAEESRLIMNRLDEIVADMQQNLAATREANESGDVTMVRALETQFETLKEEGTLLFARLAKGTAGLEGGLGIPNWITSASSSIGSALKTTWSGVKAAGRGLNTALWGLPAKALKWVTGAWLWTKLWNLLKNLPQALARHPTQTFLWVMVYRGALKALMVKTRTKTKGYQDPKNWTEFLLWIVQTLYRLPVTLFSSLIDLISGWIPAPVEISLANISAGIGPAVGVLVNVVTKVFSVLAKAAVQKVFRRLLFLHLDKAYATQADREESWLFALLKLVQWGVMSPGHMKGLLGTHEQFPEKDLASNSEQQQQRPENNANPVNGTIPINSTLPV